MTPLETLAMIGEIFSWIGLGIGLPLLLLALAVRAADGPWEAVEIAVVRDDSGLSARWFAGEDFRERGLRHDEAGLGEGWHRGWVSSRRPWRARFSGPPATERICSVLGGMLTGVGILGFAVSWLPVFF